MIGKQLVNKSLKTLLWALGFSVVGFGFYWFAFRDKPEKQIPNSAKNKNTRIK